MKGLKLNKDKRFEVFRLVFQSLLLVLIATLILFKVNSSDESTLIFPRATFGNKAYIDSVKIEKSKFSQGDKIKFDVKWFLRSSLPQGSLIAYYVFDKTGKTITFLDKPQTSQGQNYTVDGEAGKIIRDQIVLELPSNLPKGAYEVTTYIYPPNDWEFKSDNGDSNVSNHPILFNFEVE